MKNPTFSIYIPVKNRPLLLRETLLAVQKQEFEDFECVICDDGSTDTTLDVIKKFCSIDSRFSFLKNTISQGDPLASNYLLTKINGKYAARMDSDDIPKATWLKKSYEFAKIFFSDGGIAFGSQTEIFGDNIDVIFEKNKEIDPQRWACWSLFNYELSHSGLIFNRELQIKKNIYYKNYVMNNDWDFVTRLSYYGKVSNLDSVEVSIRRHSDNISASHKVIENEESLSVIKKKIDRKKIKYKTFN